MNILSNDRFIHASTSLSGELSSVLRLVDSDISQNATEIRLRINKPLTICCRRKHYYISKDGNAHDNIKADNLITISPKHMAETFQRLCGFSVYSYQKELRNGYITVRGGHRAGICGTAVMNDSQIIGMRDITSINIRISREILDCAEKLYSQIGKNMQGTLIAGAPACGKTTVLRDLARRLSLDGRNVTIIDERGELSGACGGILINDIGMCDVLNGYPKSHGIVHAIRSMAPDIIVCDEIGTEEDCNAIEQAVNSGVILIASVHADTPEGLYSKPAGKRLIKTGAFSRLVMLSGKEKPGEVSAVYIIKEHKDGKAYRGNFSDNGWSDDRDIQILRADTKSKPSGGIHNTDK